MIKNDSQAPSCTCPSGDGSLVHPCPAHPAVEQADVAAKLTFINGRPAMCGCQVEYSDGGGEYSDVIYVTLCAKHSGSAILDLVATNRIALTPEYEGQWHADLYLDREIPLAKVEGATPAEAVLALMSAERIDPEQESVEQASGDERAAFEAWATHLPMDRQPLRPDLYMPQTQWAWEAWQFRAALAQPSPVRSSLLINGYQLRAALDFIAPDGTAEQLESEACIEWRQQDADFLEAGLYAFCAEYPEEGGVLLDEEPTTAQPSPLQSEQAEAERPALWAVHAQGPDELYAAFSREDAEKHAAELNALPRPEGIAVGAVVVPSPWPAVQHWQYLAEQEQDHKNEIAGRLRQLERICEGLPQDAIDGGWTVQGIRGYAKRLEDQLKAALAQVEALRAELQSQRERNTELIFKLGSATNGWGSCEKERDAALARAAELEGKLAELEKPVPTHGEHSELRRIAVALKNPLLSGEEASDLMVRYEALTMPDHIIALIDRQAQHSVPSGWKLVPLEPTPEMLDARRDCEDGMDGYLVEDTEYYFPGRDAVRAFLARVYRGLIAAAPAPGGER
ncbi:hypothetical protein [Pseudomonas aeruginosa]|uniref:hypothetical protein n=1 Tax=Pseudomonas aeruginosa TaxID=287 RepID=UPI001E5BD4BD|nr:hypothetical protein [Pseudomonas aeruginosa]